MIKNIFQHTVELCGIASPTGYTTKAAEYVLDALKKYNCKVTTTTTKGSVIAEIGGEGNPVILSAHIDTLGAMVRSIKGNGRLRITKIGGYPEYFLEGVNCTIHCRNGKEYIGTFQAVNSAVHVNKELNNEKRDDTNLEVVIDEKTFSSDDTKGLGINAGDFISIDPGTVETESGFIKSRHLDDKAGAAILLELARSLDREKLNRKVYLFFSNYEETGHGSAAGLPEDANEILAVDMGAVGDDLETDEFKVSICAKDSSGPYNYEVTTDLINLAEKEGLNYAVAIYPFYSSDASAAIYAGANLKHGLVGPGVSASHGYERIHKEGMEATYKLICSYLYK